MNWKVHGIVIAIMTLVTVGMYFVIIKPKRIEQGKIVVTDNYVRIEEAHWGLNCNEYYKNYEQRKRTGQITDIPDPEPKPITPNNVLSSIGKLCNIEQKCSFSADTSTFGDPYKDCSKELVVTWRCFSYDKIHRLQVSEGQPVLIDCTNGGNNPPAKAQ